MPDASGVPEQRASPIVIFGGGFLVIAVVIAIVGYATKPRPAHVDPPASSSALGGTTPADPLCPELAARLRRACPEWPIDVAECTVRPDPLYSRRGRFLAPVREVRFGDPGPRFALTKDGSLFTSNGIAISSCMGITNIDDGILASERAAAESVPDGDPTRCSAGDLRRGETIERELSDLPENLTRKDALRRVAKRLGVPVKDVDAAQEKIATVCPEAIGP